MPANFSAIFNGEFFCKFFGLALPGFQPPPPEKFTPKLVDIPLISLSRTLIYSRRFSAHGGDQECRCKCMRCMYSHPGEYRKNFLRIICVLVSCQADTPAKRRPAMGKIFWPTRNESSPSSRIRGMSHTPSTTTSSKSIAALEP